MLLRQKIDEWPSSVAKLSMSELHAHANNPNATFSDTHCHAFSEKLRTESLNGHDWLAKLGTSHHKSPASFS
jgi:hypothetical protein